MLRTKDLLFCKYLKRLQYNHEKKKNVLYVTQQMLIVCTVIKNEIQCKPEF